METNYEDILRFLLMMRGLKAASGEWEVEGRRGGEYTFLVLFMKIGRSQTDFKGLHCLPRRKGGGTFFCEHCEFQIKETFSATAGESCLMLT